MRVRIEQHFPAPVADVEAALLDPAFLEYLAQMPRVRPPRLLEQREENHLVHRRVRYAFSGHLSPMVRAAIDPERLTWVEDSVVDRATHQTRFRIVPDHYADRLSCAGTFQLHRLEERTVRRGEAELLVHVAFIARKVEGAIASGMVEHAAREAEALERWLAGRSGRRN